MEKKKLKVLIPEILDLNATVSSTIINESSKLIESKLCSYYLTPSGKKYASTSNFFNFPFLLNSDGTPWKDGIRFVFHLINMSDKSDNCLDETQKRKISHLQDFKIWCDDQGVDMFDFTSRRAQKRPTYLYFAHLLEKGISPQNINNRTSIIYKWFEYYSSYYDIPLERVDQTYKTFKQFQNKQGKVITKEVETRLLKAKVVKKLKPNLGYVYDDGEELRPLDNKQVDELYEALDSEHFQVDERLIFELALDTGARKQSILTLRLKHIESFVQENLHPDGCYKIQAGFGTDIDTKFDKRLVISVPAPLAEKLKIYAYCEEAKEKREKFIQRFGNQVFKNEKDIYLFLGERGDCRYMAKSDSRYSSTNSKPNGRSISTIVKKLKTVLPKSFPQSYVFHWNRATFAYISYQLLQPLLESNEITFDMLVGWIQSSLGHEDPETTLEYLKLFKMDNQLLKLQKVWEDKLFNRSSLRDSLLRRETPCS